jgi:hypothetical protein
MFPAGAAVREVVAMTRPLVIRRATWWQRAWARLDVGPWELAPLGATVLYFALHLVTAKATGRL